MNCTTRYRHSQITTNNTSHKIRFCRFFLQVQALVSSGLLCSSLGKTFAPDCKSGGNRLGDNNDDHKFDFRVGPIAFGVLTAAVATLGHPDRIVAVAVAARTACHLVRNCSPRSPVLMLLLMLLSLLLLLL